MIISNALAALMKRAGMTVDDLPQNIDEGRDMLALLFEEIDDMKAELQLDKETGHRSDDWRIRATHALRFHKRRYSAIKKYVEKLAEQKKQERVAEQEARRRAKGCTSDENVRDELQKVVSLNREKVQRIQRAVDRQNHALSELKKWVEVNFPDRLHEAYAVVSAAQSEFDHKEAAE